MMAPATIIDHIVVHVDKIVSDYRGLKEWLRHGKGRPVFCVHERALAELAISR